MSTSILYHTQNIIGYVYERTFYEGGACFAADKDVRLFLQIHDALVCECLEERTEEVGDALARVMKVGHDLVGPPGGRAEKGALSGGGAEKAVSSNS